jgi:hypothetical protein
LEPKNFVNNGFDNCAQATAVGLDQKQKLRACAKRVMARLPWGFRKVVAFLGKYGPVNLLLSRSSFIGIYRSFADVPPALPPNSQFLVEGAVLNLHAQKFDDATGLLHFTLLATSITMWTIIRPNTGFRML